MSDNIVVAIKARPLFESEKSAQPSWKIDDRAVYQIDSNGQAIGEPYCFDHVFGASSTTEDLYNRVVRDNVKAAMEGFNCTIFAYGQTSSGKTYTMMGTSKSPGIIQLSVDDIFQYMNHHHESQFLISCAYFEIYNENVIDLLSPNQKNLKIREDCQGQVIIHTTETMAPTPNAVIELMNLGNKHRKVGCTQMNKRSSRSHSIFRIKITSAETKDSVKMSYLHLVDLAGSERVSQTKAEGTRLKEGVNINKSLSVLGNVIRQLSEQEGFINYRDSKLTRILQSALGGNSKSLLITTITVVAGEETKSSLEFAQRAKHIKNRPVINHIKSHDEKFKDLSKEYQDSIAQLEEKARRFESERDKAMAQIQLMKEGINRLMGFELRDNESAAKRKQRRHTIGSYEPSKEIEIPPLSLTEPTSASSPSESDARISMATEEEIEDSEQYFTPRAEIQETLVIGDKDVVVLMKAKEEIQRPLYVIDEETPSELVKITPELSRSHLIEPHVMEAKESSASEYTSITADNDTVWYSRSSYNIKVTPDKVSRTIEGLSLEGGDTPISVLRQRAQGLEQSFEALKEFTNLEKDFVEEEGGYVQRMIEEKDKLYNDVLSLESVLKDERSKFRQINSDLQDLVQTLSDENWSLKKENEEVKMSFDVLDLKYNQLKETTDKQIEDLNNHWEVQKKIFEDKVRYFRDQATQQFEYEALVERLEELQLEKENDDLKIFELTEKLSKFEKDQISDEEVISVSTQTDNEAEDKEEMKQLINDLEKIKKECESQKLQLTTLGEMEEDLTKKSSEMEQLLGQIDDLHQVIETLTRKNEEFFRENEELTKTVEKVTSFNNKLQDDVDMFTIQLESNKTELEQLNEELNRKNVELNHINQELSSKNEELSRKNEEFTKTIEKMTTFNKELQENADMLTSKLESNKAELEQLNEELNRKNVELNHINHELSSKNEELSRKNEEFTKTIEKMTTFNKELQENAEKFISKLESNKAELEQLNEELNRKNEELNHINQELGSKNEELSRKNEELTKTIEKMTTFNKELQENADMLTSKLESNKAELEQLNEELIRKNEELSHKNQELNSKNEELRHSNEKLTKTVEEMTIVNKDEEVDKLNKKLSYNKKVIKEKEEELKRLADDLCKTKESFADKNEEIRKLVDTVKTLRKEITEKKYDSLKKNDEINSLREELDKNKKMLTDTTAKLNKLSKEFGGKTEEINRLNRQLSHKDSETQKHIEEISVLKQEIEKKKHLIATKKGDISKLNKRLSEKSEENSRNTEALNKLKEQVSEEQQKTQEKAKEIDHLKQKLEKKKQLLEEKRDEVCKLNQKLCEKDEEIERYNTKIQDIVKDGNNLKTELHQNIKLLEEKTLEIQRMRTMSHISDINRLQNVLTDKEKEITILTRDLDEQRQHVSQKTREWEVLRKEVTDANRRYQKRTEEYKKLKEDFKKLKEQIKGIEGEPTANTETKYKKMEFDLKEKNSRISQLELQLREQIDNARKYRDQSREHMNQITKLKVQLAEQKDVLETVERRHKEKTTDVPSAKGKVAEKERKIRVHSLHDSRRSMSASEELDDVETLRSDLRQAQEGFHKKEKIIKQMQMELERIRKANDRLTAEKNNFEKDLSELEYFRAECNVLGLEVRHFLSENADLRTSLTKQIQSVTSETEQVLLLKSNFESLEKSMRELQEIFVQRENTADELRNLKEAFMEIEAKNRQLKEHIRRKEDDLDKALKEVADKEKQVAEAYNKIVDLQTDKFEMKNRKEFDKALYDNKITALESEIKELKGSVESKPKSEEEKLVQTELTVAEMDHFGVKYQMTKRLANMRREEIRKLRRRLGIPEDAE